MDTETAESRDWHLQRQAAQLTAQGQTTPQAASKVWAVQQLAQAEPVPRQEPRTMVMRRGQTEDAQQGNWTQKTGRTTIRNSDPQPYPRREQAQLAEQEYGVANKLSNSSAYSAEGERNAQKNRRSNSSYRRRESGADFASGYSTSYPKRPQRV